ncbi:mitotic spindle checkpoint protein mad1 [Cucumis melo var. makuwa]|uniref:Mitotic spindle checkpoint protein mad1 n=1 Tax=Cucumis melo var. makuwa TaxID=1194695 RepID=A0A5D3BZ56_CUCMM|nr:mitotic spindle checkpoint protein mad1 [Cucumis melo var. makuwa]
MLCKNKGWNIVGPYYDKFEMWSKVLHADPKLIPSYGGWIRVRGIPLHLWNMIVFSQIGEACGGFIEVALETADKKELTEALIKVRDNYTRFIPAFIKIHDEERNEYIVHTVTQKEDG